MTSVALRDLPTAIEQQEKPGIVVLNIPKASPSLNATTRAHWMVYYRQKKLWERLIWIAKVEARVFSDPLFERAAITITRYGKRQLDPDNLVGGVKVLVDALKAVRIITDDSPDHIRLTVDQHAKADAPESTVIAIVRVSANA